MYSQLNFESVAPGTSSRGSKRVAGPADNRLETSLIRPMDKLSFSAFGVGFAISADTGNILRDCLKYLPPGCTRTSSKSVDAQFSVTYRSQSVTTAGGTFGLARNGHELFHCGDRTEFLERFGSIVALHVADNSRKLVFIHAGVVGWGDRAIVIPGRSFSGKTTLVAELVRAGATYYSDEFAVVDRNGRVQPYPQPLQIRDPHTYRQTRCPVVRLGGLTGKSPLPIGLVVFSQYREESTWLPQELSPGVGCLQMLNNTISARSAPAVALSALKQIASSAVIVKGLRGDCSQVIQWITTHFGSPDSR
jgi:hypothetical protein